MSHISVTPGFKPATKIVKDRIMSRTERVIKGEIDTLCHELVHQYAKFNEGYEINFYDIPKDERYQLLALMFEYDGRNFYALTENSDRYVGDVISKIIAVLDNSSLDTQFDLAFSVRDAIDSYYQNEAQDLLNEAATDVTRWWMEDHGLKYGMHADNGELYIGK